MYGSNLHFFYRHKLRAWQTGATMYGSRIQDSDLSCGLSRGIDEMSELKKRNVPTAEFKAKVGLEAVRGVKTINELSQAYGVHPTQVGLWKKEILEGAKTLFEGKRGPKPVAAHQDPERLYGEIGKLKVELDWLKKKSGISLP
jgi:transposase-like protein